MRVAIVLVVLATAVCVCAAPPGIILDTDFRSDVDDVGTLALLNALSDNGECTLLGVVASQTGPRVVGAIHAVNLWYGRGDVPIGLSPVDDQRFSDSYAMVIGNPENYPSTQSNATAPDSTSLYRRLLHAAADQNVVIVVIGSQTCIHLLLASPADPEGDGSIGRTGRQLIEAKVRTLVIMGGNFIDPNHREHNIALDVEAAQAVAHSWPTPIVYSGFEIGRPVMTGGAMTNPETNPVAKAYELYPAGGVGTIASSSSYDQTALYYAVRGARAAERTLWQLSDPGWASFPDVRTRFMRNAWGRHRHLIRHAADQEVAAVIEALMIQPPNRGGRPASAVRADASREYRITDHGATPDDNTHDTDAIQASLDAAAGAGGGTVRIPRGRFVSGTIHLRDDVRLLFDEGAVLDGSADWRDYGAGRWHDALIVGERLRNVRLEGPGAIDGAECHNPKGEEGFRGPHAIRLNGCREIVIRDLAITRAGNYAILCLNCTGAELGDLTIRGGHDGLHAQACKDFKVRDCDIRTGDDCLAGCDNEDFQIVGCRVNSSCNGFRLGCVHLVVRDCMFWGPGEYAHLISARRGTPRTNMLSAFVHFAPADRRPRLPSDDWLIENCRIENVDVVYGYDFERGGWQTGQPAGRIRLRNVQAERVARPLRVLGDADRKFELTLENVSIALREDRADQEVLNLTRFGALDLRNVTLMNSRAKPVLLARQGNRVRLGEVTVAPGHTNPYQFEEVDAVVSGPAGVSFVQSSDSVDCYRFIEVTATVDRPDVDNPFTDGIVEGQFTPAGGQPVIVEGFCDSADGSVFRIRFMPTQPGDHSYSVTYRQGTYKARHEGRFSARKSSRPGLLRVDKEHPYHFVYEGTGTHFFWNSTTAYWLLGWRDDSTIQESIERLAKLGVNRIRVALSGRTRDGMRWKEPDVKPSDGFQFRLEPWPAARPANIEDPGYDVTRFNLDYFRKCERMLDHARKRGVQVSIIFHLDGADKGVDPFGKERMGGPDEQRYYRYVVARLAAFPNVMWDVTNEWHLFRDEAWVEKMGQLIEDCDPYDHLTSVHGRGDFPFRTSPWVDFAMYQSWDEHGGYAFMLRNRREQEKTGRPMPQVNEEYGYEDHYPYPWGEGRTAPARAADNRRRLAWQMAMAGGYQTTGERANVPGFGGWITGRGEGSMTMLEGYRRMGQFFTRIPWWRLEPDNDFFEVIEYANPGSDAKNAMPAVVGMRSKDGELAVLYFSSGGSAKIKPGALEGGLWSRWFNPRDGKWSSGWPSVQPDEQGRFVAPDGQDWVLQFSLRLAPGGRYSRALFNAAEVNGLEILGVGRDNPLIYDNDWWFDTPDKNYLWAKASLGQANLRGNIVTRDLWDWQKGYLYELQQGMEDAAKSIGIARRSGVKGIPDAVRGCDRVFERPVSGYIRDTKIVPSQGSELIVAEARKATPDKPLVVFVGGPLNTVANAYLMDPSIADRMVVFMTDLCGYNGKDPWANHIVATRCKLVNYGAHIWWPQRPEPPVMPLERFAELPRNEMTADLYRMAKWFWDRSTKKDKPDRDDGFADGAPIFYFFNHRTWLGVQPQRVTGVFNVQDTSDTSYDLLDVRELDYKLMTEDFFRVLKDPAVYGR